MRLAVSGSKVLEARGEASGEPASCPPTHAPEMRRMDGAPGWSWLMLSQVSEARPGAPNSVRWSAGSVFLAIFSSPVPWALRSRAVRLRARSRSKLSATKTSLPRVVMTTGPSLVE
jgi:hypothetical protein